MLGIAPSYDHQANLKDADVDDSPGGLPVFITSTGRTLNSPVQPHESKTASALQKKKTSKLNTVMNSVMVSNQKQQSAKKMKDSKHRTLKDAFKASTITSACNYEIPSPKEDFFSTKNLDIKHCSTIDGLIDGGEKEQGFVDEVAPNMMISIRQDNIVES